MREQFVTSDLDPTRDDYASQIVDRILRAAVQAEVSDVHLEAGQGTVRIRWRAAGCLLDVATIPQGKTADVLARLKALANLITYRRDIPQEGRLSLAGLSVEARVGTLPTLHGERAVIRLTTRQSVEWLPPHLGLPAEVLAGLQHSLQQPSGVILISGIAGAGKTTTAYASLRQIVSASDTTRSVVTLEDPIEQEVVGTAQSQVNPSVGYDWDVGLKALLRQDPEVLLIGEIRDAATAAVVFRAAMTGQLVITTMHARSAADALRRLLDMQVPVQHLRSALTLLLCQRLVRRVCHECRAGVSPQAMSDEICAACAGTGLGPRRLLAEMLPAVEGELARAIQGDMDSRGLEEVARAAGMLTLRQTAEKAVADGELPVREFRRCFVSN